MSVFISELFVSFPCLIQQFQKLEMFIGESFPKENTQVMIKVDMFDYFFQIYWLFYCLNYVILLQHTVHTYIVLFWNTLNEMQFYEFANFFCKHLLLKSSGTRETPVVTRSNCNTSRNTRSLKNFMTSEFFSHYRKIYDFKTSWYTLSKLFSS